MDLPLSYKIYNLLLTIERNLAHYAKLIQPEQTENLINRIVVARDSSKIIGHDNTIYWNFPQDMHRFKNDTENSLCIMGRITFDSFKKNKEGITLPLPKRYNIVVSSTPLKYYKEDIKPANWKFYPRLLFVGSLTQAHIFCILFNLEHQNVKYLLEDNPELKEILSYSEYSQIADYLNNELGIKKNFVTTIGGAAIYELALANKEILLPINEIYLTEIDFHRQDIDITSSKLFLFDDEKFAITGIESFEDSDPRYPDILVKFNKQILTLKK